MTLPGRTQGNRSIAGRRRVADPRRDPERRQRHHRRPELADVKEARRAVVKAAFEPPCQLRPSRQPHTGKSGTTADRLLDLTPSKKSCLDFGEGQMATHNASVALPEPLPAVHGRTPGGTGGGTHPSQNVRNRRATSAPNPVAVRRAGIRARGSRAGRAQTHKHTRRTCLRSRSQCRDAHTTDGDTPHRRPSAGAVGLAPGFPDTVPESCSRQ